MARSCLGNGPRSHGPRRRVGCWGPLRGVQEQMGPTVSTVGWSAPSERSRQEAAAWRAAREVGGRRGLWSVWNLGRQSRGPGNQSPSASQDSLCPQLTARPGAPRPCQGTRCLRRGHPTRGCSDGPCGAGHHGPRTPGRLPRAGSGCPPGAHGGRHHHSPCQPSRFHGSCPGDSDKRQVSQSSQGRAGGTRIGGAPALSEPPLCADRLTGRRPQEPPSMAPCDAAAAQSWRPTQKTTW